MLPPPRIPAAAPFWLSLGLVPIVALGAYWGGWLLLLPPLATWGLFSLLDGAIGTDDANPPASADPRQLAWHDAILYLWPFVQILVIFGLIATVPAAGTLSGPEMIALFAGVGVLSGTIGIVYGHELMHRPGRTARWLGDLQMASVLYSHFRSEHLLVHHRYVGTPRDAVTARYNEGFHRFLWRVLRTCPLSAWTAERVRLARVGKAWWDRRNPFWVYGALQLAALVLAFVLGGGTGVALLLVQAAVAILQLELVDYVEHYGLTRKHLGGGRYEPVGPHHSWNATQKASNWLLINLQRHSDHHYKPARPFPLLQTYAPQAAPRLPRGYPVMTMMALVPPLWRRIMNPRVRAWRRQHYPEIDDWTAYKTGTLPPPR